MKPGPQSLNTLLHTANPELGMILRHAQYLQRVRVAVAMALPEAAAAHVHVADVDQRQLVLHTDSTGWATRLRYAEPDIRRTLAQRLRMHVETIKVRVRPTLAQPAAMPVERHISPANRDYIRRVANHVNDAELARALLALAADTESGQQSAASSDQAAATGRALT